jgi:tetratricopeptide (TPR) repeat protein
MIKKPVLWMILTLFASLVQAQNAFVRGEELFLRNKPQEALVFLEASLGEDPSNIKTFLYLGVAYQQLGRLDEAVAVYRKALPKAGDETARVAYNLGNVYTMKGNSALAEQYYTQAIEADSAYASAYLNRANTKVNAGALKEAVADYEQYLTLEPRSSKRPQVEKLIAFILEEFAAGERQKLLAEAEAQEAAERRQRLLDEVSASLQANPDDAQGVSAGSEDVLEYDGEFELD